jgi:hypothetical protein
MDIDAEARLSAGGAAAAPVAPYGYDEFLRRAAAAAERAAHRRRRASRVGLVAVAGVFGLALWANRPNVTAPRAAGSAQRAVAAFDARAGQAWLESLPRDPAVVRVGPRLAAARLEDRIAWVDDMLSDAQLSGDPLIRQHELRTERARLVDSLVHVRYAEEVAAAAR